MPPARRRSAAASSRGLVKDTSGHAIAASGLIIVGLGNVQGQPIGVKREAEPIFTREILKGRGVENLV